MRHLKIFKLFLFISIQYKKCTITYFFHPQAFFVKVISLAASNLFHPALYLCPVLAGWRWFLFPVKL